MECTCDLGGCKVEGSFESPFHDGQHLFHPCRSAISFRRLFKVFKYVPFPMNAGLWIGADHRASKLHMCPQVVESVATRIG